MAYTSEVSAALIVLRVTRGASQRDVVRKTKNMTQGMLSRAQRVLATLHNYRACRTLAAELARLWVRGDGSEPAADVHAAADSLTRSGKFQP